jgi:membrane-associated protease RseP (regulator of RpoE activity)
VTGPRAAACARGARVWGAVILLSICGRAAAAPPRDPTVRVRLEVGRVGRDVRLQPEIERAFARIEGQPSLAVAGSDAAADLMLVLVSRSFSRARATEELGFGLTATLLFGPQGPAQMLAARGPGWRRVCDDLAQATARRARSELSALLRRRADWPDLGFEFQALSEKGARELHAQIDQALVTEVRAQSASAGAGLAVGDVVVALDGRPMASAGDLARALYVAAPGTILALEVSGSGGARRRLELEAR